MSCHLLKCVFQRKIAGFKGLLHGTIRLYCPGIWSMYGINVDESVDSGKVFKDPRSHAADHRRAHGTAFFQEGWNLDPGIVYICHDLSPHSPPLP